MADTSTAPLRFGTRASTLAMTQARSVADALRRVGHDVELVEISTRGDQSTAPLASIGGTGVFVTALREALLDGRVDVAVHSLKDLPTAAADGLALAAVPHREDPRDVLCARDGLKLADLPSGARLGTGSPRREAQLRALGLGLDVVGVRGNVDTRLSKVSSGEVDGVVLARAGLARLGRLDEITEVLDPIQVLPAPGQGALAVECRAGDAGIADALRALDDPASRAGVTAERSLLAVLEAGCTAPVGAYAEAAEGESGLELYLRAVVASRDGAVSIRKSATGPIGRAEQLGRDLAQELLADGAGAVVDAAESAS
ncbi:hydroxymethylbilane synthase [Haloactinopolyspora alba]|uniref:Porphobilinogen deaminase n=1 Tax=Haloactinopolyspora alba TaxID=648780 RepID=A0A2P8DGP0_9ACTN|nr:hydroxymethylbilane synthase [Haloactinopolyspora alba]PSK96394.1 hydroxymethylbilane synthase [Haloactinopolyspora alba]